jgi:type III pantothenate kinase
MMLKSYISMQIAEASQWLGDDFCVYATGGDVALVEDLPGVNVVSDLVFRGLAIACP